VLIHLERMGKSTPSDPKSPATSSVIARRTSLKGSAPAIPDVQHCLDEARRSVVIREQELVHQVELPKQHLAWRERMLAAAEAELQALTRDQVATSAIG
jgi:hypothetical protein